MKKVLLFAMMFLWYMEAYAQADECSGAVTIPPFNGLPLTSLGIPSATPSATDSLPRLAGCNLKGTMGADMWLTFTATGHSSVIYFQTLWNNGVIAYKGTCGNLIPIGCYIDQPDYHFTQLALSGYVPGDQIYIRAGRINDATSGTSFVISAEVIQLSAMPKKTISKVLTGNWSNPASWIGNNPPGPADTVIINDGATITTDRDTINIASLQIGNGGSGVAKLNLHSVDQSQWVNIRDGVEVQPGDTLVLGKTGKPKPHVFLGKDVKIDGALRNNGVYWNGNPILVFRGQHHQKFHGSGSLYGIGYPAIICDNDAGLHLDLPGKLGSELYAYRGEISHVPELLLYYNKNINVLASPELRRLSGSFINTFQFYEEPGNPNVMSLVNLEYDEFLLYPKYNYDSVLKEMENGRILSISMNKADGRGVRIKPGTSYTHLTQSMGVFRGLATDTVDWESIGGICQDSVRMVDVGHYRATDNKKTDWFVGAGIWPYSRQVYVRNKKFGAQTGQWWHMNVLNQKPSGAVDNSVGLVLGRHVIRLQSSHALGDSTRLEMSYYPHDSLKGNTNQYCLAQAPTPTGPWHKVSSQLPTWDKTLVSDPISLAGGQYFCLASSARLIDATVTKILPPPAWRVGCPSMGNQRVGLLVENRGIVPATALTVGVVDSATGSAYTQAYQVGLNMTTLAVATKDTFWVEMPFASEGRYQLTGYVNLTGDSRQSNDTLRKRLFYQTYTLPHQVNFDTCSFPPQNGGHEAFFAPELITGFENQPYRQYAGTAMYAGDGGWRAWGDYDPPITGSGKYATSYHLVQAGGNKRNYMQTYKIGPITPQTKLGYKMSFLKNVPTDSLLVVGDTIKVQVVNECGDEVRTTRTWYRGKGTHGKDPRKWHWDSIPFPAGTVVSVRFLNIGFLYQVRVSVDDITLKDTILTANAPIVGEATGFGFYPNPAHSQATLQLPGHQSARVELFDAQGRRRWFSAKAQDGEVIPLRHLPRGMYTVRFYTATRSEAQKLLVE